MHTQAATAFVAIIVGSRSDLEVVQKAAALLDQLGVPSELRVLSAHRAPDLLEDYVSGAIERGAKVFICAAGLAAHLPGVVASKTTLPVIGLPMAGNLAGGLDALLSIVQMPKGVPVATVGVGVAENAALLAAQMLGLADERIARAVADHRAEARRQIADDPANRG
ncbi:MAG TPA: 5-(carboxyamino)imidazole ribonucleotide mutase [Candidatus Limnocylindrales bacterium]|jgi:phosphoribosylaminoimidazole carboxylase PurE protein|nr:5-(carboxyamino)imidazole ribonucleotide mutase [Candidatus Limnocylindrales bacterium]